MPTQGSEELTCGNAAESALMTAHLCWKGPLGLSCLYRLESCSVAISYRVCVVLCFILFILLISPSQSKALVSFIELKPCHPLGPSQAFQRKEQPPACPLGSLLPTTTPVSPERLPFVTELTCIPWAISSERDPGHSSCRQREKSP